MASYCLLCLCLLFTTVLSYQARAPLSLDLALGIIETTGKRGAIFTLFYTQESHRLTELCSCCTCCCAPLREKVAERNYSNYQRSDYMAATDDALCMACGCCEQACPFEARQVEDGLLNFNEERCFGCGQCIDACTVGAIILEREPGRGIPIPGLG